MHKLLSYLCDELEDAERKVSQGGKLSMQELQYIDTLAHAKKNLLTGDAMMEGESQRSRRSYDADSGDMSYRRGRDSMGRYTSRDENHDLLAKLKDMVKQAENNY